MSEVITSMIAQPIVFPSGGLNILANDSAAGSHSVHYSAGTYRNFLAYAHGGTPGINTGNEADPHELIRGTQYLLNNGDSTGMWTVALSAQGFAVITYLGTGTGTIQWDDSGGTSSIIRNCLGWTTNVSLAPNVPTAGTYQVSHCGFILARVNDTGWTTLPQRFAGAEMPDGTVYGWGDGQHRVSRTFDSRFHPTDWATKTALGSVISPMYPSTKAKYLLPSAVPITGAGMLPWSFYETMKTANGIGYARCGMTFGDFQSLQSGSTTAFDDVYMSLATINAKGAITPMNPTYSSRWDYNKIELFLKAQSTR